MQRLDELRGNLGRQNIEATKTLKKTIVMHRHKDCKNEDVDSTIKTYII